MNQSSSFDGRGVPSDDDQGIGVEHDLEGLDMLDDYLGDLNNNIAEAESPVLPQEHYDDVNLTGIDGRPYQLKDFDTGAIFEDLFRAHLRSSAREELHPSRRKGC